MLQITIELHKLKLSQLKTASKWDYKHNKKVSSKMYYKAYKRKGGKLPYKEVIK